MEIIAQLIFALVVGTALFIAVGVIAAELRDDFRTERRK